MNERLPRLVIATAVAAMLASCNSGSGENSTKVSAGQTAGDAPAMAAHSAASHEMAKVETAFLFPSGDDRGWSAITKNSSHGMSPVLPFEGLSPETRRTLSHQLTLSAEVSRTYPTVRDAEAAGYRRVGPFVAGLGVHYFGGGRAIGVGLITDDEILHPMALIYDGSSPDAPITGVMYRAPARSEGAAEPEGFAGANDHWHVHLGTCFVPGPQGSQDVVGANNSVTAEDCKARGGQYQAGGEGFLHVWTTPAYTNPLGVFGHRNPAISCPDGTYYSDPKDFSCAHR